MRKFNLLFNSLWIIWSLLALPVCAQNTKNDKVSVKVSGKVTSAEEGLPLIGVNVITDIGTGITTLENGHYTIAAPAGSVLTFQYLGYRKEEFTVPTGKAECTHDVVMHSDSEQLEDVVVIAYGVRKKSSIAGSVSSVKAEKIENTPTAAFDQALQGQVSGLTVLSSTGEPSASASMVIRGTNSINSGTAPLYILDGVAISAADFNTINPADIESLSVLKDAASTSIYGARAANGVIVITTKRGRMQERPIINYRMQLGISQLAYGQWHMMNTEERIQYEKEIGLTTGKDYNLLSKINVNWLDEVFNNAALLQNYELSISGANDRTNYYLSAGYYSQEGTAVGSNFNRYSMRINLEQKAAKWLKVGTNTMLNYQRIEQADEGAASTVTPISAAQFMLPYWNPYRADGSYASVGDGTWKGTGVNPLEWLENNPRVYKKYKLFSTLFAEATLYKGLTFKSQFSVDYSHTTGYGKSFPEYAPNQGDGAASRSTTDDMQLQISNTLNYQFDLGADSKHHLNLMVGQEGLDYHYESFMLVSEGQNNNKLTNISTGTRVSRWGDTTDSDHGYLSFFLRGEYNYDNRFFVEGAVRTDASSRFGAGHRWGRFGSLGFMWNMANEKFLANSRKWLTQAQISLSTGTAGNSSIPNYEHLALVAGGASYIGDAGMLLAQPGNENLSWETTWSTNLGLHFGFWNRLNVDLELYNKKTTDLLMYVPQSYAATGFGFSWDNVGSMVNRGVELSLAGVLVQTRNFQWAVNTNVSYNKNKITELYNGIQEYEVSTSSTKLVVGHDSGEFYINRYAGVNPANGDALWYDRDGNITTELRDSDKVLTGKSFHAPWQGGFGTALTWKGLSLSAQFSWVGDRWMVNNDRFFNESNGRFTSYNQSRRLLERWKNPGDVTDIPRHGVYTEFDDRLLEDASFLRLKNLSLSYTLPDKLLRRTRFIQGARIYVQAQNLLTFTNFSGIDPEGISNIYIAQYPMARQFTFGLDLTF